MKIYRSDNRFVKCDRCKLEYSEETVRKKCPHPAVNRVYGEHICAYCCKKCKFSRQFGTGWVCGYGKEKQNDT